MAPVAVNAQSLLAFNHQPGDGPTAPQPAHGQVVGRVVLADGQAAEQVSVMVKGTTIGTSTEADGSFRLRLPVGKQILAVAYLGYVTQEIEVDVPNRSTVNLPTVTLAKSTNQLTEVKITETRTINQRPTGVSKMPVRPFDLPQSVVTVSQQTLEQQQVLRLSDAIVNVSGIYVTSATGGTQEELGSRGFAYGSNNTFKNGVRFNNGVMPEASSLESMEVLKGSAAILYGNVAAGGVLNLVTKKPKFEQGGSVGLRVGSFGFWKPMVDVYGAVGQSEKVAFRLNTTYEQGNSFRDRVESDRFYVNPSLLFKLSPKTTLVVEGDYLRDNRTPDFGVGAIDYKILESRTRFLNVAGANNATQQTSTTATLSSQLSDVWQVRGVVGFQRYDNEQRSAARPVATVIAQGPNYGNWNRNLQRSRTRENYYLAQLDFTANFHTGFLGHTLLAGTDVDQYQTNNLGYTARPYNAINLLDPTKKVSLPAGTVPVTGFDDLALNTRTRGNTRRAGFYVQDMLTFTEQFKALIGMRWSYQETPSDVYTYTAPTAPIQQVTVRETRRYDNAWTPRLGLVYQPIKTLSLFASYSNSFAPNSGVDNTGTNLAPSMLQQYEVGVKNELFNGMLSANVTAYQIVNDNQAQTIQQYFSNGTPNPAWNQNIPAAQELAGEVTSKGVEVDVHSKPYLGWTFIAGYSYNNTAYTKSNIYDNGSRLRYNPAHTANLSAYYTFNSLFADHTFLRGLNAGITSYYVGDKVAGRNPRKQYDKDGNLIPDANKFITVPNYLLFDASVGYTYERFSLRVKAANLLDVLSYNMHDDNSVNPIAPRNYSATFAYKFR
ncbi:TonB-dependent siderophore receptor [Hymenobacter coalescens]